MAQKPKTHILIIILVSLILLALIILGSFPNSKIASLTSPFSSILSPVYKVTRSIGSGISGFFLSLTDGMNIRNENERLREENTKLKNKISELKEAGKENRELKAALNLKEKYLEYELIGGHVLSSGIDNWFDLIRIDVGKKEGIVVSTTQSYAVVNADSALVGRVMKNDSNTCKILPLIHEGFSVSAKVNQAEGVSMRVHGNVDLKPQGLCQIDQIPQGADLNIDDEIVTSGYGGFFPSGIVIGKIIEIEEAETGERTAVLRPQVDFNQLDLLFVMKGK